MYNRTWTPEMGRSMERFILLLHFLLVAIFAELIGAGRDECPESRCRHHGPAIRFPFRLKDRQPEHCGYPGFDLYCNDNNQAVLELPSSVKLLVKNINYKSHEIQVYDEHACLPRQLPHLKLSASPFQFKSSYSLGDYTFLNCSSTEESWSQIPCLSGLGYDICAIPSDGFVHDFQLLSCTKVYNVSSLPYELFGYQNIVLHLNWSYSICEDCEAKGRKCGLKKNNRAEPETQCLGKLPKGALTKRLEVIGAVFGSILLVLGIVLVLYRAHRLDKIKKEYQVKIENFLVDYKALKPTRYSYADIKRITNQLKDKLGEGGYGTVFKGNLTNEILVAVKILNNITGNGEDFINEVGTMATIHHVNVVRLVGFCADGSKRALVYEFLPNESLEKFIFSQDDKKHFLGWEKLQDIALGTAKGIEYLHQGCDQRILHFDIKPHNILLDGNFNPKISDFGLAKLCSKEESVVSMTAARGTMGYIAPEMLSRNFGNVSYKSDIYSFGMMLLEMVGGRKNIDIRVENPSQAYFPEWVYNSLDKGEELRIRIEKVGDAKIAKKLTIVGLWCIQWYPVDRPSMKVVVQMLEGDGDNLIMPPNPFASTIQMNSTVTY
ncbi:hypothetical protein L1049_020374 [Liquidambar formosana]|uniref:Protein kinase domain-containing protein n=1 Tax=Liquidambar formosana TaxID=63359 RepID=A0AAP0X5Z0_LIQFO